MIRPVPSEDYFDFWGKAQPSGTSNAKWHPTVYHLLDVAAAAEAILSSRPVALGRGATLIGLPQAATCQLVVALVALHDLGKFTPAFQSKATPIGWAWPEVLGRRNATHAGGTRHTDDGYLIWRALRQGLTARLWPHAERSLSVLAPAIFGHHGRPCRGGDLGTPSAESVMGAAAVRAAAQCANALLDLLHPEPIAEANAERRRLTLASWWLAGLTTLSDWVGSRQEWFPYAAPTLGLAEYWNLARTRAANAVRTAGLVAATPAPLRSFASLTGIATPAPAQRLAETIDLGAGSVLVIIEDVTGSGKTEAAQVIVHRLMATARASGAYWAMPTQATANAMYERQSQVITQLYEGGSSPSLALAHAASRLHEVFRDRVVDQWVASANEEPEGYSPGPSDEGEPPAGAGCAAFLADDRRAALLAAIGAGSVDQALLAVLPSRFNALRLFGLADKVLVVDEAHAYDAYMRVEVNELLRFHAALGGSAVVLSATLSRAQREQLVQSWAEGAAGGGRSPQPVVSSRSNGDDTIAAYPLMTIARGPSAKDVVETAFPAASWSRRQVPVRFVSTVEQAIDHVIESARRGAAVAWVRNTVNDALFAADRLRQVGISPEVFHARFALGDRQVREAEVMGRFGKTSTNADRRGRVLVATQVIEQSLDLDFDVLVTDLAPIDLLIQRAGRLWRHNDGRRQRPQYVVRELVVLAPPFHHEPRADWVRGLLPGTARVYEDAGVLWRTVRALSTNPAIDTPDRLRSLIESVYGCDDVPDALAVAAQTAHGKRQADAAAANYQALKVTDGYDGSARAWSDDLDAATRLADEQTVVRLARVGYDGRIEPWDKTDAPSWRKWALSEIRLRTTQVPRNAAAENEFWPRIEQERSIWKIYERSIPVLPLVDEQSSGEWVGRLLRPNRSKPIEMSYSPQVGLAFR